MDKRTFLKKTLFLTAAPIFAKVLTAKPAPNYVTGLSRRDMLRFAVISDTHFGRKSKVGINAMVKVPRTLKNLFSKTPLVDALFVVGDITDNGRPDEYQQVRSVFGNRAFVPQDFPVYFMMGNHDYHHFSRNGNPAKYFTEQLGQEINQYVVIKKHPFITISLTPTRKGGKWRDPKNCYDAPIQRFLAEKLKKAAQDFPGKPIFVFCHVPPANTCYGSVAWGMKTINPILEKYPQVITFSGHSHFPVGHPHSIQQGKFTAINDGSIAYTGYETYDLKHVGTPEDAEIERVTEGLIVNVLGSGDVEIERWDTFRDEEILPRWLVKAPHDGSCFAYKADRKGLSPPAFAKDARPIVTVEGDACVVAFPQAVDDEIVLNYIITLVEEGSSKVLKRSGKFSQFFWNSEMPRTLSIKFDKLVPTKKKLIARVVAEDAFRNQSMPIESAAFAVASSSPDG
ncbi:MAG: metallophosphoesterase [Puniceicoccales bacterium]|nr:metallophosphoesterase [Puniceicoccales bacterium]